MTPRPDRILFPLLHFVFFLSGIATVLIGQVLPLLAARFQLSDLELGYFFPAQFAGSLIGTFLTRWFGKSGKLVAATTLGSLLMAAGIAGLNAPTYELTLAAFFVNGLGIGLTLPAINILILELRPETSAASLSFLNFFWGVGAIVSKPFVDLTASGNGPLLTTVLLAGPLLIAGIGFLTLPGFAEKNLADDEADDGSLPPIWTLPMAWAIAAFNFIHVGFESGVGGWLTTYAGRIDASADLSLITPTFLYFLFFVIGRGIAPLFLKFLDENRMLLASLVTILAGLCIALTADGILWLSVGSSISGIGTSAVFPTNVSRFSKTFGPSAARRATPLFICGTLGSMVITWLIGFLSDKTGSLRSGMFVLLFSVITLIVLQSILTLRSGRKAVA